MAPVRNFGTGKVHFAISLTSLGAGSASMLGRALWSLPSANPCLHRRKCCKNSKYLFLLITWVLGEQVQPKVCLRWMGPWGPCEVLVLECRHNTYLLLEMRTCSGWPLLRPPPLPKGKVLALLEAVSLPVEVVPALLQASISSLVQCMFSFISVCGGCQPFRIEFAS